MAQRTETKGLRELGLAMQHLGAQVQNKIARNAVTAGARVIREAAKRMVPVLAEQAPNRKPGTIKKNIRMRVMKSPPGTIEVSVGVRKLSGKKIGAFKAATGQASRDNPDDPYYWRFVEFGTRKMAATPFLRPAYDSQKGAAAQAIQKQLAARIQGEANKAKK